MVSHHRATAEIHCICSGFKIYTITQRIYDYSIFIYSILAVFITDFSFLKQIVYQEAE